MPRFGPNQLTTIREATNAPTIVSGTTDRDDWMWRRTGGSKVSATAIPAYKQQQSIFVARYLYQFNPFAKRLTEILRDFVVGSTGFEVKADDPDIQQFLNKVWDDRHNKFNRWVPEYTLALSVDGELSIPVQVVQGNPIPAYGYMSPLDIRDVRSLAFRRGTAASLVIPNTNVGEDDIILPVISGQSLDQIRTLAEPATDKPAIIGAFFNSINGLPDHPRGTPDLFSLSDDLDQFNKTNWARMRKTEQQGTYVWDITLTGAGPTLIDEFEKNLLLNPPMPGGYRVHNDRVAWTTVEPSHDGHDASTEMRYQRSNMSGEFGIPDFFLTGESGAGRMATSELWSTVIATAGNRQRIMKLFLTEMMDFALDWATICGEIDEGADRKFRITAPIIGIRDLQRMAGMIVNLLDAVLTMHSSKIIGDDSVRGMIRTLLINLGFDLRDDENLGKIVDAQLLLDKAKLNIQKQAAQNKADNPGGFGGGGGGADGDGPGN